MEKDNVLGTCMWMVLRELIKYFKSLAAVKFLLMVNVSVKEIMLGKLLFLMSQSVSFQSSRDQQSHNFLGMLPVP